MKYANSIGTVLDYYKKKLLEATNDNDSKLVKKFAGKLSKISDANLKFYDKIKKLSKWQIWKLIKHNNFQNITLKFSFAS